MKASDWLWGLFVAAALFTGASAQETKQEIRIGVLGDMSGTSADIGGPGSITAAQLAIDDFGGMVAGRKVELLSADHQQKPDIASAIARRWYGSEGVDAIVDVPVSSAALAVQAIAREQHKVFLITGATTAELTGKSCSPWTLHWAENTYTLASGMTRALVKSGGSSWFLVTLDFAFGYALEAATKKVLEAENAKFVGSVKAPLNNSDWASFILQAQQSKAKIVAFAAGGTDFTNGVKAAQEFGLVAGGQRIAGYLVYISDVNSLGLNAAQGLVFTDSFYWDQNDEARAFAKRFFEKRKVMPTRSQAATYAATVHYLSAVKAVGSASSDEVVSWMKANDARYFGYPARARADGRVTFPVALWEVKKPSESKGPWDYYRLLRLIPPDEAFNPPSPDCALSKP
jgi:branched-chain amino acid transport system substrate-binding protein